MDSANAIHQNLETQIKSKTTILKQLDAQIMQKKRFLADSERLSLEQQPPKRPKPISIPQKPPATAPQGPQQPEHGVLPRELAEPPESSLRKHLLQLNVATFFAEFPLGPQMMSSIIPGILNGTIECGCLLLRPLEQIIAHELSSASLSGCANVLSFGTIINAFSIVTEIVSSCKKCKDSACGCFINGGTGNTGNVGVTRTMSNPLKDMNTSRFITPLKKNLNTCQKSARKKPIESAHENTEILDLVVKNISTLCTPLSTDLCSAALRFLCTCLGNSTASGTAGSVSSNANFATLITYGEKILESGVLKCVLSPENKSFTPKTREFALELIEILMQGFRPAIVAGSSDEMSTDRRSLLDDVVYVLGAESFGTLSDMRPVRLRAVHMFLHIVVESNAIMEQDAADSLPVVAATITQHNPQNSIGSGGNGSCGSGFGLRSHQTFAVNSEYLVKGVCALLEHELNGAFNETGCGCRKDVLEIIQVTSSLVSCFQSDLFPSIDDVSETPGIISKLKKFAAISSDVELNISASKLERLTSTQFSQTQQ